MKVMTIRLDDDRAAELELVARIDGLSIAKTVEAAITSHIATRTADPAFRDLLRQRLDADRDVARRLSGGQA